MTCPNGKHIMDSSWPECPYCRSEGLLGPAAPPAPPPSNAGDASRRPTVVEGAGGGAPAPFGGRTFPESQPIAPRAGGSPKPFVPQQPPPQAQQPQPVAQQASPPAAKPPRSATVFANVPPTVAGALPGTGSPSLANTGRKIVGILVTYSWRPEGQVFPVRVGRNLIGRDPECEICVPEDQTMSARNSHITFRENFVVGDMVSMMGTYLNDKPIEEQFKSLANYAQIRAGSTHFTFIMVNVPEAQ